MFGKIEPQKINFNLSNDDKTKIQQSYLISSTNQQSSAFLGKMKTDFWSLDNLNISEKLDEVNKLKIILPCGFDVEYGKKYFKQTIFDCPICKDHSISSQDCLNMTRNKLVLNEKLFELKKNIFGELVNNFEKYKKDPNYHIESSHENCFSEIDLRREQIILTIKEKIDHYYKVLLENINLEKKSKLKNIDVKIKEIDSKKEEIDSLNIDSNLDVYSKINALKSNRNSIDDGINLVSNIQNYLTQAKFKLTDNNLEIDVEDLFGDLYLKEETTFIYNEDEIGDDNRSEATIQLVINDFSKFSYTKYLKFFSKRCKVKNFEWSILIKVDNYDNESNNLGFYLQCNLLDGLSRFPANVNAQFILVDSKNQNYNLTKSENYYFDKEKYQGFDTFIVFSDLSDLKNFYNREDDSIILKVVIK